MTRPGDLVYCVKPPHDPLQRHGVRGTSRPSVGCVYTVATVMPGKNGGDTYLLEEVNSRGTDIHGENVMLTWNEELFIPCRRQNVHAMLQKVLSVMTVKQEQEYQAEYAVILKEADKHRKAKY